MMAKIHIPLSLPADHPLVELLGQATQPRTTGAQAARDLLGMLWSKVVTALATKGAEQPMARLLAGFVDEELAALEIAHRESSVTDRAGAVERANRALLLQALRDFLESETQDVAEATAAVAGPQLKPGEEPLWEPKQGGADG